MKRRTMISTLATLGCYPAFKEFPASSLEHETAKTNSKIIIDQTTKNLILHSFEKQTAAIILSPGQHISTTQKCIQTSDEIFFKWTYNPNLPIQFSTDSQNQKYILFFDFLNGKPAICVTMYLAEENQLFIVGILNSELMNNEKLVDFFFLENNQCALLLKMNSSLRILSYTCRNGIFDITEVYHSDINFQLPGGKQLAKGFHFYHDSIFYSPFANCFVLGHKKEGLHFYFLRKKGPRYDFVYQYSLLNNAILEHQWIFSLEDKNKHGFLYTLYQHSDLTKDIVICANGKLGILSPNMEYGFTLKDALPLKELAMDFVFYKNQELGFPSNFDEQFLSDVASYETKVIFLCALSEKNDGYTLFFCAINNQIYIIYFDPSYGKFGYQRLISTAVPQDLSFLFQTGYKIRLYQSKNAEKLQKNRFDQSKKSVYEAYIEKVERKPFSTTTFQVLVQGSPQEQYHFKIINTEDSLFSKKSSIPKPSLGMFPALPALAALSKFLYYTASSIYYGISVFDWCTTQKAPTSTPHDREWDNDEWVELYCGVDEASSVGSWETISNREENSDDDEETQFGSPLSQFDIEDNFARDVCTIEAVEQEFYEQIDGAELSNLQAYHAALMNKISYLTRSSIPIDQSKIRTIQLKMDMLRKHVLENFNTTLPYCVLNSTLGI